MSQTPIVDDELVNDPKSWLRDLNRQAGRDTSTLSGALVMPDAAWRGLYDEYRRAMKDATEAADEFHFSTLLARASATIGRRVWFKYGMPLYPNFYIVDFGPTGDRKTTALRYFSELGTADIKIVSGTGSGEGLADELQDLPPGAACIFELPEFTELLRRGRWEGSTVLPFLTNCYDCPPEYEQKYRKNPVRLVRPTPYLLAGTTAEWFWTSARLSDFQGGFGNRLLFFTGKRKAAIPLPKEPDLSAISEKIDALKDVPEGPVKLAHEAEELWRQFYGSWEKQQQKRDPMLQVAVERIPAHILKIAMVHAALEDTLPYITRDQLKAAILTGNYCCKCAEEILSLQHSGTNRTKELERRILAFVGRQPGAQTSKRQIYRGLQRHYANATEFDRSFRALVHAGELFAEPGPKGSWTVQIP